MSTATWTEHGVVRTAHWHSENGAPLPARILVIDDATSAQTALRLARPDTALLWRGDYQNARHLMRAMDRRLAKRARQAPTTTDLGALFQAHRAARAERSAVLGKILIELEPDYSVALRRAPDVRAACAHAYGLPAPHPSGVGDPAGPTEALSPTETLRPPSTLVSLSELVGVIGAYQWHLAGIEIPALGERITPAYGVFTPTRDEYLDLVAEAPFPRGMAQPVVFDIGTGTGVIAAILARRGARSVIATDLNPRAVACAQHNAAQLGLADRIRVTQADLWPDTTERADVVVCNPPWLPGTPTSDLELGVYDPESDVLHRFLAGLADRLTPHGEGWLVLSDLAELLGLRTRAELLERIAAAGLEVVDRLETAPRHSKARDAADPLHEARSRERTALWRLAPRGTHA